MGLNTKVTGKKTKCKDKDSIIWSTVAHTVASGLIINFMEKGYNLPLMVENTTVILKKVSNMDRDSILGETENNMMDNGKTENNMERVYLQLQREKFVREFGLTVCEHNGWKLPICILLCIVSRKLEAYLEL